jgi:hypothetical protein
MPIPRAPCSGNLANGDCISTALCGRHRATKLRGLAQLTPRANFYGGSTISQGLGPACARNADAH